MTPRLKLAYDKEFVKNLIGKLNLKNKHEVPKIEKIILNMGLEKTHLMVKNLRFV